MQYELKTFAFLELPVVHLDQHCQAEPLKGGATWESVSHHKHYLVTGLPQVFSLQTAFVLPCIRKYSRSNPILLGRSLFCNWTGLEVVNYFTVAGSFERKSHSVVAFLH